MFADGITFKLPEGTNVYARLAKNGEVRVTRLYGDINVVVVLSATDIVLNQWHKWI